MADGGRRDGNSRLVARGIWSGSISFGLVSVPVELYSAQRRARPPLRMLGPEGTPLSRQYVCPKEGKPLGPEDIERGYEVGDGKFVIVQDKELEQLAPRKSRDIEIHRFVDRAGIDPGYFERAYFLVPGGEQTKAYRLLAEIMEKSGRAAIASFVMRGRGYAAAIFADRGILRAETLRFGDEVRQPADLGLPDAKKPKADRVRRMEGAIEKLAADALDESELVDDQVERMLALAEEKQERGEDVVQAPEAAEAEEGAAVPVLDLMELLRQRMRENAPPGRARKGAGGGRRRSRSRGRRSAA